MRQRNTECEKREAKSAEDRSRHGTRVDICEMLKAEKEQRKRRSLCEIACLGCVIGHLRLEQRSGMHRHALWVWSYSPAPASSLALRRLKPFLKHATILNMDAFGTRRSDQIPHFFHCHAAQKCGSSVMRRMSTLPPLS